MTIFCHSVLLRILKVQDFDSFMLVSLGLMKVPDACCYSLNTCLMKELPNQIDGCLSDALLDILK